jgi:GNAT superfamily N-acetyltransferase
MDLPLGWHTDVAVLLAGGSEVESFKDHLVVRTPTNPTYHWGHFVLVTDPDAVADAGRWVERFTTCFPGAQHRAIGLVARPPADPWTAVGLEVQRDQVLVAATPLGVGTAPDGYTVRALEHRADWQASNVLRELSYPGTPDFTAATTERRAAMTARGLVRWFGAFDAVGRLAAELGIVDCGDGAARYQSVLTHPDHRRRGLAGLLLGVADAFARDAYGASRTVIVADADGEAARLYRARGFEDDQLSWQAYCFSV